MGASIERFEDGVAWQRARALAAAVYQATPDSGAFAGDFSLRDQICCSQLSVAFDAGYARREAFGLLRGQAAEVGRTVGGLRASTGRWRARV